MSSTDIVSSLGGGSLVNKIRTTFAVVGGVYVLAVGLLAVPYFQSHTIYLNAIRLPWFANFDAPEKYGLALNKTYNFKIHTTDNETLGSWFIFSDSVYQSLPTPRTSPQPYINEALRSRPTILFFHGNAATRAYHARVQHYSSLTSRLHVNILAIDYRGFAESSGSPTEEGLVRDARAAWEWLLSQGAKGEDILIMGHSLGTGVGARLAAQLSEEGLAYRAVVLMSPFSSIESVLKTYNVFGAIPLIKPLALIPYAMNFVSWALIHKFDTLSVVPKIKGQVLIAHAENDWDIPYTHSEALFNAFLEPLLPSVKLPFNPAALSKEEWSVFTSQIQARNAKRDEIVTTTNFPHFGTVSEFTEGGRNIVFVKTLEGQHDYIGVQEGLQDIIGQKYGLFETAALVGPASSDNDSPDDAEYVKSKEFFE
ncbi:abhydrolase domain-containing protein 12 [Moniliophthora roreri MCA 2997]|uniref:Abhydrolase domain-containing protein 12 n=2 Tax=Moniliophthora roreri TaxID=221103 RepID=V2YHR5_MONRO|nr:abhydrolase domain-containing protein 12 [Moniliophthora roreri MCA 2997]KAI3611048.1 abhydrolase domain-containing protein 12 [Moniliophthora roreri]